MADAENTTVTEPQLNVGSKVLVAGYAGSVCFIGETHFGTGTWVGLSLDAGVGKNDGTVQDIRYFTCEPGHGLFVRKTVVKLREDLDNNSSSAEGVSALHRQTSAQDDVSDYVSDDEIEEVKPTSGARNTIRRGGVSAEVQMSLLEGNQDASQQEAFQEKSPEQRKQLRDIIRNSRDSTLHMLFGGLSPEGLEKVVDAMFVKLVKNGETIIRVDDHGDYFIVKSGSFEIFAYREIKQADENAEAEHALVKVFEAGAGFAFGEMALMHDAPRSRNITATQDSEVWCLGRAAFRQLVSRSHQDKFEEYVKFLQNCDIFSELSKEEIAALAEVFQEEDFDADEAILEQGERDDKMFILLKGKAFACIRGEQGEVEVMQYNGGDYFGEIALLTGEPRKASVYANGPVTCLFITSETFNRVLGPLKDFLMRNMSKYQKYHDAISQGAQQHDGVAVAAEAAAAAEKLEREREESQTVEVFAGGQEEGTTAAPRRKLLKKEDRAQTVFLQDPDEPEDDPDEAAEANLSSEGADEGDKSKAAPAGSLAARVVEDFTKPQLVSLTPAFGVPSSKFSVLGGLRVGEKFTNDKVVIASPEVTPSSDGLDEVYRWTGASWLKGSTHISILCQKGQKAASDPTPNQDNYFAFHIGAVGLYGVADGHGPFGHLVSFRLVQTLPHFLTTSPHFGKDWEKALTEAFLDAQKDLLSFCDAEGVNLEASGAAGSILVFEGPSIHIAHIGDAGAMVGSWNRHDSRLILGTKDHKPQSPVEKARLEAAGSEVREVDVDSYRIYIQGTNFPGLTMSRAFGDTACKGVLQEPEYNQLFMQPGDEWYAIIASDGIWEFLDYEKVVELTSKKLRLKGPTETVAYLTEASRKRWDAYCGDYCDDITAILVQWNANDKSSGTANFECRVRRQTSDAA